MISSVEFVPDSNECKVDWKDWRVSGEGEGEVERDKIARESE